MTTAYQLNVHKLEQRCLFELTWGRSHRITASVAFPSSLLPCYNSWRRAYLGYYQNALRGRVGAMGQVQGAVDWHSQLVQAEARLLSEFHQWLKQGELFDLREVLKGAGQGERTRRQLFLTCAPLEIARLPWETWEFGPHLDLVRSPATLQGDAGAPPKGLPRPKSRVLAILGDDTGLNFTEERSALANYHRHLTVDYVGWQPGEEGSRLKERICQAIADPQGWDILFFAGHSNESSLLDGEVAIAPRTSLTIKELAPYLQQAQARGLQFAFFNSCSGLDIAHGLINLGLSQVAIMREPIHNDVAQDFFVAFLRHLAQGQHVQAALQGASQTLKLEKALTYPSAHLVPSLFRHPEAAPYRLPQRGWRAWVQRWRPQRREAIALAALMALSFWPPAHHGLLNQRVWVQAVYRDLSGQVPAVTTPPVVVVQIDQETFQRRRLTDYKPIDRSLLADLITQLAQQGTPVVGVDYLLDLEDPQGNDATLRQALAQGISQGGMWPVMITSRNPSGTWSQPYPQALDANWVLQGNTTVPLWHFRPYNPNGNQPPPFSYQLALAHYFHRQNAADPMVPRPRLQGAALEARIAAYLRENPHPFPAPAHLHPLTSLSYRWQQRWLQPLMDLSLPPQTVYQSILAWQFLADPQGTLTRLERQDLTGAIAIIAAGGYYDAGITRDGDDNFAIPPALGYWLQRQGDTRPAWTGGEAHAYLTHHLTQNHWVIPLPDLWFMGLAVILGKGLALRWGQRPPRWWWAYGGGGALAYGWLVLQLYISLGVMVPWALPMAVMGIYGVIIWRANSHGTELE